MSFPRYERYKDTGVEWLGEVPDHWSIRRMKTLFEIKKRIAGETGFDILSITQNGIKIKDTESNEGQVAMDYAKYQFVYPGDFAMNHMDLLTGYIDISKVEGVTSPDYRVFSIRNPDLCRPGYFLRLFQSAYHRKIFYAFGQGASQFGRWRLPTEAFNDFALPYPPTSEQVLIDDFLDRETAKIDALIEEQYRLIELLKEKRQAVISHAVTKGLDPEISLKDSGIKWLGSVPETWIATTVRRIALRVLTGGTPSLDSPTDFIDGGIKWFTPGDWTDSLYLNASAKCVTPAQLEAGEAKLFPANSTLIISIGGTLGKVGLSREDSSGNQQINAVVPSERVTPEYLNAALSAQTEMMKYLSNSSTIGIMNQEKTKEIAIAIPDIETQREIVDHIDKCLDQIGRLLEEATSSIKLLEERRSALISAAVTGKIDVRNDIPKEAA